MELYAAMRGGLLVADEAGTTEIRLDSHDLECVAATPDHVFCGTFDAGLFRSDDGGETFHAVGRGTIRESVMSLAIDPTDPKTVWVGTEPSAVYRSEDAGESWEQREGLTDLPSEPHWSFPPRPHTHHVRWIEPDPHDPEHLYVGIEAGALVQTHDAGETWEDRVPDARLDNHSLTTHPEAPNRVWSAAGDGYAESVDGGETWAYPQDGLDHRYCWSVAVVPDDPDTVLVSSATGPRTAHNADAAESYVYRKRNGKPWKRLDSLETGASVTRAVFAVDELNGKLYAVTNRGIFRTEDAGTTWEPLDLEWPPEFERQTARGLAVVP
ncbi:WD40/YVTN/BNR-like repeat-containing protein [Haladaptatus sp. DFWS20]|uniref:WD40/YVTN/BNR-like repeat-containing protein n=1 Tax=Haladaptatus sp. DFWS20 TaxID=3403467 RepID=UPI003EC0125E